jgi:hypothetical protein
MQLRLTRTLWTAAGLVLAACSGDALTGTAARPGQGMLAVRLTDAPLPIDSVAEVNIFVERIDARRAHAEREHVDDDLDHEDSTEAPDSLRANDDDDEHGEHADSSKWVTIAEPNQTFNLLTLRNGVTAFLGASPVDTGHFKAIRLVIDPTRSNVVLKDGTVLTTTSSPAVEFERKGRHALFVELEDSVEVDEGSTTTLTIDVKLDQSLTLRGKSVRDGFYFRPAVAGWTNQRHH